MLYGSSSAYSVGCVVHILFGGVLTMVSTVYTGQDVLGLARSLYGLTR